MQIELRVTNNYVHNVRISEKYSQMTELDHSVDAKKTFFRKQTATLPQREEHSNVVESKQILYDSHQGGNL